MHIALQECKRLLHYDADYAFCMTTPNQRLREARAAAGFRTAKDAAESMGVPVSTYIGHENGHRGFPAARAPQYARKFKVTEEWLLFGKGEGVADMVEGGEPTTPIPLLGDVPAGNWREAVHKTHHYIPAPEAGMPKAAYALKVAGDSMDKIVKNGATIIIDPTDLDLFDRSYFVVRNRDGETTFKQYLDGPARLVPCSTNPEHKITPLGSEEMTILGRVILITMRPDQAALD